MIEITSIITFKNIKSKNYSVLSCYMIAKNQNNSRHYYAKKDYLMIFFIDDFHS